MHFKKWIFLIFDFRRARPVRDRLPAIDGKDFGRERYWSASGD